MSAPKPRRHVRLWILCVLLVIGAFAAATLRWGGYLLIANDRLPAHVDAAVVLQGSTEGVKVRVAGAIGLLQQGVTEHILLSIPPTTFWDEPTQPAAYAYLERTYSTKAAQRVLFCTVGPGVNSTEGEAQSLYRCIHESGWNSIVVVTSNYHSRRARMLWRRMLRQQNSGIQFCLYQISDSEFQPQGWWHTRLYAKTWFFEFTKLVWAVFT